MLGVLLCDLQRIEGLVAQRLITAHSLVVDQDRVDRVQPTCRKHQGKQLDGARRFEGAWTSTSKYSALNVWQILNAIRGPPAACSVERGVPDEHDIFRPQCTLNCRAVRRAHFDDVDSEQHFPEDVAAADAGGRPAEGSAVPRRSSMGAIP